MYRLNFCNPTFAENKFKNDNDIDGETSNCSGPYRFSVLCWIVVVVLRHVTHRRTTTTRRRKKGCETKKKK